MSAVPVARPFDAVLIPEQVATCSCGPDEYRPCRGEFYRCEGCGLASDDPMPMAEPMNTRLDLRKHTSWWFYCRECGEEWRRDGCAVLNVVENGN